MYPTTNPIKTILFAACLGVCSSLAGAGCVSSEGDRGFVFHTINSQQELIEYIQQESTDTLADEQGRLIDALRVQGSVEDLSVLSQIDTPTNIEVVAIENTTTLRTISHLEFLNPTLQVLTILENDVLETVDLQVEVSGFFSVSGNPQIINVSANTIEHLSDFVMIDNATLQSAQFTSLTQSYDFSVTGNPNLCALTLPKLASFDGGSGLQNNPCLPSEQVDAINALRTEDAPTSEPNGPAPQPETPAPEGE